MYWNVRIPEGFYTRQSYAGEDMRHWTLDRCSFTRCDFRDADLRSASLRGAHFAGCDLRGADLRDADLTHASFSAMLTHDIDHGRTDVTGVRWNGAVLRDTAFERVIGAPDIG